MHHYKFITKKQQAILARLAENIKLARLRRKLSIRSLAERAGIAVSTMVNVEAGSPSVSLGNYLQVLSVLRLEEDLILIADNDPVGRMQDAGWYMFDVPRIASFSGKHCARSNDNFGTLKMHLPTGGDNYL